MFKLRKRGREAGLTVIEAAVAGFVVAISVAGLSVSVVYGRSLERYTATTWRATSAATAVLESLRSESASSWGTMKGDWDQQICSESGFGDPIGDKMVASVGTSASQLDDQTGMYNSGATTPNFYFVTITPKASEGLSDSLRFQTYVANRGALAASASGSGTGGGGSGGGGTGGTSGGGSTAAESLSTTPASVAYSGQNKTVTFTISNSSSSALSVTDFGATSTTGIKLKTIKVNTKTLYSNNKGSTTVSLPDVENILSSGLAPGTVSVEVSALTAINTTTVTLAFTFSDGSVANVSVAP